jgi:light-independent protochlorophyllide reductase subunit B
MVVGLPVAPAVSVPAGSDVAVAEAPMQAEAVAGAAVLTAAPAQIVVPAGGPAPWTPDAEKELKKIPFFVRGKARRNTERFALDRGLATITVETLYDAKAHFGR